MAKDNLGHYRVVISGDKLEIIRSARIIKKKKDKVDDNLKIERKHNVEKPKKEKTPSELKALDKYKKNKRVKNFINTVNCNKGVYGCEEVFITINFKDDIEVAEAKLEFAKFIKRLNYRVFKSLKKELKYSYSMEYQQRGTPHFHIIVYNIKDRIEMNEYIDMWKLGGIFVESVYDANKLASYMTKEILWGDNRVELGHSNGMRKPIKIDDIDNEEIVNDILVNIEDVKKRKNYRHMNKYLGLMEVSEYKAEGELLDRINTYKNNIDKSE